MAIFALANEQVVPVSATSRSPTNDNWIGASAGQVLKPRLQRLG